MLVPIETIIDWCGRPVPVFFDTDELDDEDYAKFRKLWDSGDKLKAKQFLRNCSFG